MNQEKKDSQGIYDDNAALVEFLDSILDKAVSFTTHFDTKANILMGLSVAIFLFSNSALGIGRFTLAGVILSIFSGISALVSLYSIHPPKSMRRRGQIQSLMYYGSVAKNPSHREYAETLKEVMGKRDQVTSHYANEIYNLYKYYYIPKRRLFLLSRNILVAGIALSLAVFLYEFNLTFL